MTAPVCRVPLCDHPVADGHPICARCEPALTDAMALIRKTLEWYESYTAAGITKLENAANEEADT